MDRQNGFVVFVVVLVLGLPCATGLGITTVYTDRAEFLAEVPGATHIDFEGLVPPSGELAQFFLPGLTLDGVTFAPPSAGGGLYVVEPAHQPALFGWGSGAVLNGDYGSPTTIDVTLPVGTYAVGCDLMTFFPYGETVNVALSTGQVFAVTTADYPTRVFAGFITDTGFITSVTYTRPEIDPRGSGLNIDNFVFDAKPVPEPLTTTGAFLAIGGLGAYLRKRTRA